MGKTTPLDLAIARQIRGARKAREMTQPLAAAALSISYQSYQKLEAGKISFRASTLVKLAELFQVPVTHFYGEDGIPALKNGAQTSHVIAVMQSLAPDAARRVCEFALQLKNYAAQKQAEA